MIKEIEETFFITEEYNLEELCKKPCIMGIDEAGRGPVLGPMVYGCCFCLLEDKNILYNMGFADSKQLSETKRNILFEKIRKCALLKNNEEKIIPMGWMVEVINPEDLSLQMLKIKKINLNIISHNAAINLIEKALKKGINIKEIFIDTVGIPSKYEAKLKQFFPKLQITVSKKADSIYPIVSAASICAKVIRDNRLRNWKFKENEISFSTKFGSGYPGDPITKQWLKSHLDPIFGFPSIIRFSWKTTTQLLDKGAIDVFWTKREMEDHFNIHTKDQKERAKYFAENYMELVIDFE
jgi:ribonuclease H2 subunit A